MGMRVKRITALLLAMVLMLGNALAQNITWHNAGEEVVPVGNTLAYTIQKAFMGTSGGQTYLLMAVDIQAGEAGAALALKDFVAMTREDEVFYPLYAQSADKVVTVTEAAPLVIPAYGSQALTFVFPVREGLTDFILVYRNAPGGDFYATNAAFGGQSESNGGITVADEEAVYTGIPPALRKAREAEACGEEEETDATSGATQ